MPPSSKGNVLLHSIIKGWIFSYLVQEVLLNKTYTDISNLFNLIGSIFFPGRFYFSCDIAT